MSCTGDSPPRMTNSPSGSRDPAWRALRVLSDVICRCRCVPAARRRTKEERELSPETPDERLTLIICLAIVCNCMLDVPS